MIQRWCVVMMLLCAGIPAAFAVGGDEAAGEDDLVLRFSFWGDQTEKATVEAALEAFSEARGIAVEPMHIPQEYNTKMTTLLAANDPPHSGYLDAAQSFVYYEEGKVSNLMPLLEGDPEVGVETWIETNYFWADPETIIGLSGDLQTIVIFYNRELFDRAGLSYPPASNEDAWTWDEFIEVAKALTIDKNGNSASDRSFDPESIVQYGAFMPLWDVAIEALMLRNGTPMTLNDGTGFALAEPAGYEVVQAISDAMNVHYAMPTPVSAGGLPGGVVSLQTGKYAMVIDGHWQNNSFGQIADGLNWDVGVLPYFTTKNILTVNAARVMFPDAGNTAETWELMKFMADPAAAIGLFRSGLWAPSKLDYYTDPDKIALWADDNPAHPPSYREVFFPMFMNAENQPSVMYVKDWGKSYSDIVAPALDAVWSGERSAREAMLEITPMMESLLIGAYVRN